MSAEPNPPALRPPDPVSAPDPAPDLRALRAALPRTWDRWLARFGRPTPIQIAAIPLVASGRSALLMAPTASGKTEAALVPLLERYGAELRDPDQADGPPVLLVVSPTKALVNDLHRRLSPRLEDAGIPCGRWTGDGHDKGRLHRLTFLTLESLDSRLSRDPASLRSVRAVWIEEIHAVDGSVRGDQLQILLSRLSARLRHAGAPPPQFVATSASVPDPASVAARYLGPDAAVIRAAGRRALDISVELAPAAPEDDEAHSLRARLLDLAREGARKFLIFVDNRARVEVIAGLLRGHAPFQHAAYAHHGSMEAPERQSVEQRFLRDRVAVCVATSTLEVGIDIGDIDAVLLLDAPPTVPALLQRAGRSGRRGGGARVIGWISDPVEALTLRVLADAEKRGDWLADPHAFRPSVLAQQCMSILGEREESNAFGLSAAHLQRRLPPHLAAAWDDLRVERLLMALCGPGWLKPAKERYARGEVGDRLWQRGELHTNLGGRAPPGLAVVDASTGQVVGRVQDAGKIGEALTLGGRSRRILSRSDTRVVAESARSALSAPKFESNPAAPMPAAQARALLAAVGLRPGDALLLSDGAVALAHGLGTAGGRVLAALLAQRRGIFVKGRGPLAAVLYARHADPARALRDAWPAQNTGALLDDTLLDLADDLRERLALGPYHDLLPAHERLLALRAAVQAEVIQGFLAAGAPEVRPLPPPASPAEELREALLWR